MVNPAFEGCQPKENTRVSLDFLTSITQFSSRIIRLAINILYIYRFITAINGLRLRGQPLNDEEEKIRAPYMCATRHHLSVEPDVTELHKELRKIMYRSVDLLLRNTTIEESSIEIRFKQEVRFIAHTIKHYPQFLVKSVPLLESSLRKLQCSLDDLELAATFDGLAEISPNTACYTKNQNQNSVDRTSDHSSFTANRAETQSECDSVEQSWLITTDDWEQFDRRSKNNNMSSFSLDRLPTYQTESLSSGKSIHPDKPKWKQQKSPATASDDNSSSEETLPSVGQSGQQRRLEADEEQVYLIARNAHLALHTLLINAKYNRSRKFVSRSTVSSPRLKIDSSEHQEWHESRHVYRPVPVYLRHWKQILPLLPLFATAFEIRFLSSGANGTPTRSTTDGLLREHSPG